MRLLERPEDDVIGVGEDQVPSKLALDFERLDFLTMLSVELDQSGGSPHPEQPVLEGACVARDEAAQWWPTLGN